MALACIGTAVALYPVVKRQNQGLAMGLVGVRVLGATTIVAGVACLVTVVRLRQDGIGADALVAGQALVGLYDSAFLLSQSVLSAFNALLLGSLLYRSRLVRRVLPALGLVGARATRADDHPVRRHLTSVSGEDVRAGRDGWSLWIGR